MKSLRYFLAACAVAMCLGAAAQQATAPKKFSLFYGQRATLFDILPVNSDNIVFLGNSITNGCEWHELLGMPNVINRGISGDIVDGVEERLQPIIDGKPAKIFLMIGVNDVSHDLTADSIASAVESLAARIRRETPSTKLYVESLLPINNSYGRYKNLTDKEQVVRDINAKLRPAVEAMGATWVELYESFSDEDGNLRTDLTNDGLHLLGKGYLLWRDIVMPFVLE